ncbi:protein singed wings 2 isoform X1 [Orussus abietinus]|uniref:protein singed wings 2 isoform X1 n=1 Tax=Orussus abietinus TaxID=222816 RepID=UPI0006259F54|nr:protein singed wings 2 isoform X1 [Orussus abietinus]
MKTTFKPNYYLVTLAMTLIFVERSSEDRPLDIDEHEQSDILSSCCRTEDNGQHIRCFGGFHKRWLPRPETVKVLEILDWPERTFDPERHLRGLTSLEEVKIVSSNLSKISSRFPRDALFLKKVSITGTDLQFLPRDVFVDSPNLRYVDLRNNSLGTMNPQTFEVEPLREIYLSGNKWKCSLDNSWILDSRKVSVASRIVDRDKLRCHTPFTGRPLLFVMEIIERLERECKLTPCDCNLVYIVNRQDRGDGRRDPMALASMNCSSRGLVSLPNFLPRNTTTLHLANNKITDLSSLATNPEYRRIVDVYLNDNLIESIAPLEGSHWLDHFRLLDLRGNKLSDLPTYALENALLQSRNAASIYLGNNPWRCDCSFTPGFQDLLVRYERLIKDINDVKCSADARDDNSNKQIRELTRTEICVSPEEESWLYPLDVLNVILALLILLIIGKLVYDYWSFKKTGNLPWLVTKIP